MAGALDLQVQLHALVDAGAQIVGGSGLARTRDVVELTFDGHQRCGANVLRTHALGLALAVEHVPGAVDQLELLKHRADGLEVVVRIHVEHCVVLVVELAVRLDTGAIALDQVFEIVVVALGMAVRVHGHKAGMLHEARVDASACAREVARDSEDHVVFEPVVALVHGQVVDRSRRLARIDRPTHHGHGQRRLLAMRGHQRDRGQHRHGGLANADHMAVAVALLQVVYELLHVVHVVIEVEVALIERDYARVSPVGDVDLVVLEHALDRIAQQRGVVARQRGHDQHDRLQLELGQGLDIVAQALEAAQLAKRLVDLYPFLDGHRHAVDLDRADAKSRLFVVFAQTVHQAVSRRHALRPGVGAGRGMRVAEHLGCSLSEVHEGLHHGALGFKDLIEHGELLVPP